MHRITVIQYKQLHNSIMLALVFFADSAGLAAQDGATCTTLANILLPTSSLLTNAATQHLALAAGSQGSATRHTRPSCKRSSGRL